MKGPETVSADDGQAVPSPWATDETSPRYRSGAVARMARMPVATLRIWERRYQVAAPAVTASGQRLYSAADVQRLALIKQLCDLGHAIGSLAALSMAQLHQVAVTHATTLAGPRAAATPELAPWRAAIVGAGLARRLQRPSVLRRLGRALEVTGPFDNLAQVAQAQATQRIDLLLVHASALHDGWLPDLQAARDSLGAPQVALLYGYATEPTCRALASGGVALLRDPQSDTALASWVRSLIAPPAAQRNGWPAATHANGVAIWPAEVASRPRYDDATLADIASLSTTIACECPRHVAELLMQLTHFEAYSGECAHRSPADAALHAYLQQVAGSARSMFEAALERVAVHEGLVLTQAVGGMGGIGAPDTLDRQPGR